jgi:thioredoxin 1
MASEPNTLPNMETLLNNENFSTEVLKSDVPVLVDFWAEWCAPCLMVAPVLAEISQDYQGRIKIGKLNVDEFPEVAGQYNIRSIPNMKIFKQGKIVDELVGAMPKSEIIKHLEKFT